VTSILVSCCGYCCAMAVTYISEARHAVNPVWAEQRCSNTLIGTLAVDGWAVTFGTARRPLLAVPNVTAHLSTASVPTSHDLSWQ